MIRTCGQACSSRVPPSSRTQQFGVCTGDVGTLQPTCEYSAGPAGLASCRTGHYPGSACALVLAQCCSAVELGRRAICSLTGGGGDLIGWASYLGKICRKNCYGAAYYWVYKTIWIYILYRFLKSSKYVQTQASAAWERFRQYDPKTAAMEEVAWPENAGGISTMGWKRSIINRYQISTVLF